MKELLTRKTRGERARAGFTLAEVLLTVLIMSGILVAITQILHAARTSRDTIHNIKENHLAGPAIMDMIERDLRGVITYNRTRQLHFLLRDRVMLGLDGDSIDFVSSTDSLVPRADGDRFLVSDINEVGYRCRPNPTDDDFLEIYRREDMGIDDEPFLGGEFSFLHDRVKSFDVLAFAEDGPDAEPLEDWGEEGEDEIGLPARIEITLVLENAQRLQREQLLHASPGRKTVTYKRVIRLPELLRREETALVVPTIPAKPAEQAAQVGGPGGGEGEFTEGTVTGGGGGGGGGGRGGGGGGRGSGETRTLIETGGG